MLNKTCPVTLQHNSGDYLGTALWLLYFELGTVNHEQQCFDYSNKPYSQTSFFFHQKGHGKPTLLKILQGHI